MNPGEQPFSTTEAVLAFSLYSAGCQFIDDRAPCFNLFDAEILGKLGYRGMPLLEAASQAWEDEKKGHVEWSFHFTQRTQELIHDYRDQCKELETSDAKASDLVLLIMEKVKVGAMLPDEGLLRIACVNLKTRIEFMNLYKKMVPLLKVPDGSSAKDLPSRGSSKLVRKPGFKVMSLNLSEEKKKELGL